MSGKKFVIIMVVVLVIIGICSIAALQLFDSLGRPDSI